MKKLLLIVGLVAASASAFATEKPAASNPQKPATEEETQSTSTDTAKKPVTAPVEAEKQPAA